MDYYNNIKNELINNEVYKKVKDYSKNKSDLSAYYNVGKLLIEAQGGEKRAKYGDGLIKEYSKRLIKDVGKQYNVRTLRRIRQFYLMFKNWSTVSTVLTWSHYSELLMLNDFNEINYYIEACENQNLSVRNLRNMRQFYLVFSKQKWQTMSATLSWSHYIEMIWLDNLNEMNYYINISVEQNLSVRQLRLKIKNKEYQRLDDKTKEKLINKEEVIVSDFIKNPILIKNSYNYEEISEKILKQLILEDLDNFLSELGEGFTYIKSEYKIKIGDTYNYIDLLLFNIKYNCYIVVELKVTELRKEYIGQIEVYMNYVDRNIKEVNQDKTIGIIIVKKDNQFVMEYASDERIYDVRYELCQ